MKNQVKEVHKEVLKDVGSTNSPSAMKTTSSNKSSKLPALKLPPVENGNNFCFPEEDKQNPKRLSILPMPRTPSDGYNWRKYGQKQGKSPEGSRSYYRCTFSDCYAKKIECCDISNRPIETVYRSHHNHDPPQKLNVTRENKPVLSLIPIGVCNGTSHPAKHSNDQMPSTLFKEHAVGHNKTPETKQESCGSDENTRTLTKEQYGDSPNQRKGKKEIPQVKSSPFLNLGRSLNMLFMQLVTWEYQEMATDGANMGRKW